MTLRKLIASNRDAIDAVINGERFRHDGRGGRGTIPDPPPRYNDAEREEWIKNHEPLYRWAQDEGCRI